MALLYKDSVAHASGCRCCDEDYLADAGRMKLDPTGTGKIRRAMKADMAMRWRSLRPLLMQALVTNDLLGIANTLPTNALQVTLHYMGGANKVQMFQMWFDQILKQKLLQTDGTYLRPYINRGYAKGMAFGEAQANVPPSQLQYAMNDRADTLTQLAIVELQGVMEAVSQQAVRAVTNGLLVKARARNIVREIMDKVQSVGVVRTNTIAEYLIVRAFGEATLDVYERAGVTEVGLLPEVRAPLRRLGDAAKRGPGSRTGRARVPSTRTVSRIRRVQRELEALQEVNVRTAGDDDVCPVCEEIAEDGPYEINTARSLIPAHPNCRCAFIPARDRRFSQDRVAA